MDTSRSSLTMLDLIAVSDITSLQPDEATVARLLFEISTRLHATNTLATIIGNRPITAEWVLWDSMQSSLPTADRHALKDFRAREIYARSHHHDTCSVYLAYDRQRAIWLSVCSREIPDEKRRVDDCRVLSSAEVMAQIFRQQDRWYGFGLMVLNALISTIHIEEMNWQAKLEKMSRQLIVLEELHGYVRAAYEKSPTSGTGIEG